MKNQVLAFILCLAFVRGYGQLMINQPYPGTQTYDITAPEYIRMMPGFEYIPQSTNYFMAYIDPNANLINPVTYIETPVDPEDRPINTGYEVGTTAGQASVSLTGGATYTIPIYAAPGTAGMQPSISLVYNSQAGNGIAGYGWNIAGLSSITRVPRTIYHDGAASGISFNIDDFALDGQRLIYINSSSSENTNNYYTEVFNGNLIIAHLNTSGYNEWFEVKTKDGLTLEYGVTPQSRLYGKPIDANTISWNIENIKDANGNYIHFIYNTLDGKCLIKEIQYTDNPLMASPIIHYNNIKFYYGERIDKSITYVGYKKIENDVLLDHIDVLSENNIVKTYKLKYYFNFYSKLNEVEEYGCDNSRYNSTAFGYNENDNNPIIEDINLTIDKHDILYADFDMDGYTDIFYAPHEDIPFENEEWRVFLNDGTGHFNYSTCSWIGDLYPRRMNFKICDLNGDGLIDIIFSEKWLAGAHYYYNIKYLCNTGDGFTKYTLIEGPQINALERFVVYPADIESDGKDEFFIHCDYDGNDKIKCYKAIYDNGTYIAGDAGLDIELNTEYNNIYTLDLDRDGGSELLFSGNDGLTRIYTFRKDLVSYIKTEIYNDYFLTDEHNVYPGDFNGDGIMDILTSKEDDSGNRHWMLNYWKGFGFNSSEVSELLNIRDEFGISVNDYNGDGKTDICVNDFIPSQEVGKYDLIAVPIYFNNDFISIDFPINLDVTASQYFYLLAANSLFNVTTDFNGDGINDVSILSTTLTSGKLIILNPYENKNNVTSLCNGLNGITKFEFSTLADNNVYSCSASLQLPLRKMLFPLSVVKSTSASNGLGSLNIINYKYSDGILHVQGKGFLGFMGIINKDNTTGYTFTSTSTLNNTYYFLMPDYSKTEYPEGIKLNETNMSFAFQSIFQAAPKVYFPYASSVTTLDHISKTKTVNQTSYDQYANVISSSTDYYPTHDATSSTAYNQNTYSGYQNINGWCPSKPSDIQNVVYRKNNPEANSSVENTPITTKKHFTYYTDGNLETEISFYLQDNAVETKYLDYHAGMPLKKQIKLASDGNPNSPDIRESTTSYDKYYRFAESVSNCLGQVSSATYDPVFGNKITVTDPNLLTVTYIYDGFGRIVKSTDPENVWAETHLKWYSGSDKPNVLYYSETTSNNGPLSRKYYDKLGRALFTADENPDGQMVCTQKQYNAKGLVTSVSEPYFENATPAQFTITHYDNYNRLWYVTLPTQVTLLYTYTPPSAQVPGFTTSVFNSGTSTSTSKITDATGKIISATDPGGTITYDYYSDGQPKSIIAPDGSETTMVYDEYGHQTNLSDPDAGEITYKYNAWGELSKQTDANGKYFDMTYDKLGRLLTKTSSDNSFNITNVYDTQPHGIGLLSETGLDNGYKVSYAYDSKSRIISKTEHYNKDYTYLYTYDAKGNLDKYTFPSGYVIKYTYNSNGSLASVTDKTANKTIYVPGQYNARGQMLDYTNSDGTIYNTLTYDDYGMPATVMAGTTLGGNEIQYLETHFNQYTGNLQYRTDHRQSLTETFTYDPTHNNRLVTWQVDGQPEYSMTYDDDNYNGGNILTKSDFTSSGNPYNYTDPNDPNHPHAVKSVTDPLQSPAETLQHIIYNSLNKVSEIIHTSQGLRYTIDYGPDEQRVKSRYFANDVLQKTKYYIGGDYEEEVNSNNVVTRRLHYLPGGGLYVLDQNNNGTRYYVLTDYQGSWCRVITDAGVTVERYSFDPWGRRRHPDNWNIYYVPTSFTFDRGYTGHEMLDAFGLINMNGRVYDPIIARFLSPDNYVQAPDNSQGFNRYSYCLNNPLVYTDPSGNNPLAFIAMTAYTVFYTYMMSQVYANTDLGFQGGVALGLATSGISMVVGGAIGPIMQGTGVIPGMVNAAVPAAIGGTITYGLNSIVTGQPFDWKGWGLNVGMACLIGGVEGEASIINYNEENPFDLKNIWTGEKVNIGRTPISFINNKSVDINQLYYVNENGNIIHLTQYYDPKARNNYPIYYKIRGGILDQYTHKIDLETNTEPGTSVHVKIPQGYKIKGAIGIESDRYYWPKDGGVEYSTNTGSNIIVHTGPNSLRLSHVGLKYIDANIWGTPFGSSSNSVEIIGSNIFHVVIRIRNPKKVF